MRIKEFRMPGLGICVDRISDAFHKYFPNVEWTNENPDFYLIHAMGQSEVDYFYDLPDQSKAIIVQENYALSNVSGDVWHDIWKVAKLTTSFHPLYDLVGNTDFNFIRTPLGADTDTFNKNSNLRDIKVFTTGHIAETESIDKMFEACRATDNKMYHTGENFRWDRRYYNYLTYLPIDELATLLSRCQYTSGLRLQEGFELHCIEGAMMGTVPIIPNIKSYDFYKDFGIYIDMEKDIVTQLIDILNSEYKPLSTEQIEMVRHDFSWETICKTIYDRIVERN